MNRIDLRRIIDREPVHLEVRAEDSRLNRSPSRLERYLCWSFPRWMEFAVPVICAALIGAMLVSL